MYYNAAKPINLRWFHRKWTLSYNGHWKRITQMIIQNWNRFLPIIATLDCRQHYNFMKFICGNCTRISKSILCCRFAYAVTFCGSHQEIRGSIRAMWANHSLGLMLFLLKIDLLFQLLWLHYWFSLWFHHFKFIFKLINFKSTCANVSSYGLPMRIECFQVKRLSFFHSKESQAKSNITAISAAMQLNTSQNDTGR